MFVLVTVRQHIAISRNKYSRVFTDYLNTINFYVVGVVSLTLVIKILTIILVFIFVFGISISTVRW